MERYKDKKVVIIGGTSGMGLPRVRRDLYDRLRASGRRGLVAALKAAREMHPNLM